LITTEDYMTALTVDYKEITGEDLSTSMREMFEDVVGNFNRDYPERFVVQGVQNPIARAFQSGCLKLDWDGVQIEAAGARSIARFKSRDWVRSFLKEMQVPASAIRADDYVRDAADVVTGRNEALESEDPFEGTTHLLRRTTSGASRSRTR
jgi:hypothetical protein